MTLARSIAIALLAVLLVTGARPGAAPIEQYPRGLMSVEPATAGNRTCTIDVRPVSFGVYDPLATTPVDALGQVIYVCGNLDNRASENKTIRIELTTGLANTFSPRRMAGPEPGMGLEYNLFLDATHRTVWGQGAFGTDVYVDTSPPNRTPVIVPIYGRIEGQQDLPAGQYGDVLTARVVF